MAQTQASTELAATLPRESMRSRNTFVTVMAVTWSLPPAYRKPVTDATVSPYTSPHIYKDRLNTTYFSG